MTLICTFTVYRGGRAVYSTDGVDVAVVGGVGRRQDARGKRFVVVVVIIILFVSACFGGRECG